MHSFVRSVALVAALATLAVGTWIACLPALANSDEGSSAGSACGKYPEGSKQWKKCMGQVRRDLEDTYALGYWMAKTGEYDEALKILAASDQSDPRVLTSTESPHYQNFIDAIRAGDPKVLTCDVLEGHMSSTLPHLANISYRVGRSLTFDGKAEKFVGDKEADRLLTREYRKGFEIPSSFGKPTTDEGQRGTR